MSYQFPKKIKIAAIWRWKSTPGFGFNNSTRLAMFKSLLKPNFDKLDPRLCYYYFVPEIWRGAKISKIESSNLARRFTTRTTNERNGKIRLKEVRKGSRDLL